MKQVKMSTAILTPSFDNSVLVKCPSCKNVLSFEEDPFEVDEIGWCKRCRKNVYIPWEEYLKKGGYVRKYDDNDYYEF
ncbi:MAG: hypothetical protein WC476_00885 [Phycisphaerae bacterium]|jgi:hypothetical protein